MRSFRYALAGILAATGLAACRDVLTVENRNDPDRRRVLATPADLEAVTVGAFRAMHQGSVGGGGFGSGLVCHARAAAGEESSTFNNFGLNLRGGIPRVPINNTRQGQGSTEQLYDFNAESVAARTAADGLNAMAVVGVSTGSAAQDARLRAFAWFTLGVAEGNLALVYDSAALADPYADLSVIAGLSSYREVMTVALANLDSALAWTSVATAAVGSNVFPLPSTWINGSSVSAGQFIQLIRSYKAHFRVDVARTRAEGDAVDWPQVLADASNGVTTDLLVTTQASPYWNVNLCGAAGGYGVQVHQLYAGMADTSGGFEAWLRTPLTGKTAFLVVTPDARFPQGLTRAAQQANSPTAPTGVLYFRNRTTTDIASVDEYGTSFYEWYRFYTWIYSPGGGPYPVFSHNQNDMLQAEAYIRTGNIPAAAALIDISRTRVGLPALAGVITALDQPVPGGTAADPVPGGASCVPRIPVGTGPEWTGSKCGDIWEAMKWELRMENMFVGYAAWYFPARRWNDLPEGTPLHWPVPWQEMDARRHPFYNLGGVGGRDGKVGKGTYGL